MGEQEEEKEPEITAEKEKPPETMAEEEEGKGRTLKMRTGCGNLYVTINKYEKAGKYEILVVMEKSGGCTASNLEAVGRLSSLAIGDGSNLEKVIEELKGIRCPSPLLTRGGMVYSCADAIAKALEMYYSRHIANKE